ncbi:Protein-lysine N-methyltransferase (Archaeal protein lysine methyltransferase) (aKMT) [Durusdinium trenchii]|uniref:Protein-lysine N-methyltransferase (Archaeal protein lysine methyltransferase) (AKMT) n=1 Tax=Durusdinium trenchii TaxID=1381693 RepID=A0ABP0IQE3_9DINO
MEGAPKLAPFNPSSKDVLRKACELARPTPEDVVFDLGCGDGRLLVVMAKSSGCAGVGLEYDEQYYRRALADVEFEGLQDRVEIRHADVTKVADLDRATIVFVYLSVKGNKDLNALLQGAFDRGAKIVSNMFTLGYLGPPSEQVQCDGITMLYLYDKNCPPEAGGDAASASAAKARGATPVNEDTDDELSSKRPGSAATAAGEGTEEKSEWLLWLEYIFDPLRNPYIIQIFNGAMTAMVLLLTALLYFGLGNIHIYNISMITICLLVSVNWFLHELRKAVDLEESAALAEEEQQDEQDALRSQTLQDIDAQFPPTDEVEQDLPSLPKPPSDKKHD